MQMPTSPDVGGWGGTLGTRPLNPLSQWRMRRRAQGNGSAAVQWASVRVPRPANGRAPERRWEAAGRLGRCWLEAAEAAEAVAFPLGSEVNAGGRVGWAGGGGGGGGRGSRREAKARPAPTARARGAQSGRSPRRRRVVWLGLPPPPRASGPLSLPCGGWRSVRPAALFVCMLSRRHSPEVIENKHLLVFRALLLWTL